MRVAPQLNALLVAGFVLFIALRLNALWQSCMLEDQSGICHFGSSYCEVPPYIFHPPQPTADVRTEPGRIPFVFRSPFMQKPRAVHRSGLAIALPVSSVQVLATALPAT